MCGGLPPQRHKPATSAGIVPAAVGELPQSPRKRGASSLEREPFGHAAGARWEAPLPASLSEGGGAQRRWEPPPAAQRTSRFSGNTPGSRRGDHWSPAPLRGGLPQSLRDSSLEREPFGHAAGARRGVLHPASHPEEVARSAGGSQKIPRPRRPGDAYAFFVRVSSWACRRTNRCAPARCSRCRRARAGCGGCRRRCPCRCG